MSDTPSRMFALVCVLIALWVGVYWLYEPRTRPAPAPVPAVTIDSRPPAPEPVAPPPEQVRPSVTPVPVTPEPAPTPSGPHIIAPKFRQYVVQQGDVSFESIAQRLFHDRKKWEIIARANPFVTSDRLKPGKTVLNIPLDENNIQGKLVDEGGAAAAPKADTPPPAAKETTYVIQADDTLWGIAKKVYGKNNGGLWERIYEANRDVIKNKDRPPVGGVLKIPPPPKPE